MQADVVVGYDQGPHSEQALAEAADAAARRQSALVVVHAFDSLSPTSGSGPEPGHASQAEQAKRAAKAGQACRTSQAGQASQASRPQPEANAQQIADQGATLARSRHADLEIRTRTAAGPPPTVLTEAAHGAALLVIGHRGHGCLADLVRDSVAVRLAARPACPTMVVRRRRPERRGTVLAAFDLEDPAEAVLAFAFEEARLRRTALHAVSVRESLWPRVYAGDPDELRSAAVQAADNAALALEHTLKRWQERYPEVHVRHELLDGSPGAALTAAASFADLVVVGAHHHHGAPGRPAGEAHIGPTISPLLLRADCPVVITPRD